MRTVGPALMRTSTKRSQDPSAVMAALTSGMRLAGSVSATIARICNWYAMRVFSWHRLPGAQLGLVVGGLVTVDVAAGLARRGEGLARRGEGKAVFHGDLVGIGL